MGKQERRTSEGGGKGRGGGGNNATPIFPAFLFFPGGGKGGKRERGK